MSQPTQQTEPILPFREIPAAPDEVAGLLAILHRNRRTFAWKAFGLDHAAMNRTLDPSILTLAGLTKHLALVEDHYFTHQLHGRGYPDVWAPLQDNENWDFDSAGEDSPEQLQALWLAAVERSDAAISDALAQRGLDTLVADSGGEAPFNLRRMLLDIIEEYARHTGHADLIRESIDGLVGEGAPKD